MKYFKVAAAIIKHNDEILCMQRPETECLDLSLKYEFPGGKIEVGETAEEALERELK